MSPSTPEPQPVSNKLLWQETELAYIQSSPQKRGHGPRPRVLGCQKGVFISLRTPESPIGVYLANKRHRELGEVKPIENSSRGNNYVKGSSKFFKQN
jgi:hypothetical protein